MTRSDKQKKWEKDYLNKLSHLQEANEMLLAALALRRSISPDLDVDGYAIGGTAQQVSGNSYPEKAWNFLAKKGFTAAAAAGVLGNLRQESGIDPTKKQSGGGPGRGVCQWEMKHSKGGGRWEELVKWAKSQKLDEWAIETQLEYMWIELNGKDPTAVSILKNRFGGIDGLRLATDYKFATRAFEESFERAGKPMMEKRYTYAKEYLDKFGGGKASSTASTVTFGSGANATGKAKLVLDIANSWLSKPNRYVLGAGRNQSDIKAGKFDCSSWCRYVFEQAGINIGPLTATTKTMIKLGKSVRTEDLQPGDLAFFDTTNAPPGHVTIYLGGGKCIGSQSSTGVGVFDMNSNYWKSKIHREHRRVI